MIGTLLGQFWPYIAGGITILLAALGLLKKGERTGRRKEQDKNRKIEEATNERIVDVLDKDNSGKSGRERLRDRRNK